MSVLTGSLTTPAPLAALEARIIVLSVLLSIVSPLSSAISAPLPEFAILSTAPVAFVYPWER